MAVTTGGMLVRAIMLPGIILRVIMVRGTMVQVITAPTGHGFPDIGRRDRLLTVGKESECGAIGSGIDPSLIGTHTVHSCHDNRIPYALVASEMLIP